MTTKQPKNSWGIELQAAYETMLDALRMHDSLTSAAKCRELQDIVTYLGGNKSHTPKST